MEGGRESEREAGGREGKGTSNVSLNSKKNRMQAFCI